MFTGSVWQVERKAGMSSEASSPCQKWGGFQVVRDLQVGSHGEGYAVTDKDKIIFYTVNPLVNEVERADITQLLAECGLDYEKTIELFVVGRQGGRLVACGGLDCNVVKCVATSPEWRGEALSLKLMSEIVHVAHELGRHHLFLFTRPYNVEAFQSARSGCLDGEYAVRYQELLPVAEDVAQGWRKNRQYCHECQPIYSWASVFGRAGGKPK